MHDQAAPSKAQRRCASNTKSRISSRQKSLKNFLSKAPYEITGFGRRLRATGAGSAGGNGRVIQVYFDAKATLTVSGATENQYRILRSVPLGMTMPY